MRERGMNAGFLYSKKLAPAQPAAGLGQTNRLNLDGLQAYQRMGDMVFCVTQFRIVLATLELTVPAQAEPDNYLDSLAIAAALQVSLFASPESPFGVLGKAGGILNNVTFRGLEALQHVSNMPIFESLNRDQPITDIVLPPTSGVMALVHNAGWFARTRPVLSFKPAGGVEPVLLTLNIPVGFRLPESEGMLPIPAAYFSGKGCFGGCDKTPGYIEWKWVADEMAGIPFTQTGNTYAVYVDGVWVHESEIPIPPKLCIEETAYSTSRPVMQVDPGAIAYAAFRSSLDNGDETVVQADKVVITCRGEPLLGDQRDERLVLLTQSERRPAWQITQFVPQVAINAPYGKVRYVDPASDVLFLNGTRSLKKMPGDDSTSTSIQMTDAGSGAGASTNTLVTATYVPRNAASDEAHFKLYPRDASVVQAPASMTGSSILPAKQVSAPVNPAKG